MKIYSIKCETVELLSLSSLLRHSPYYCILILYKKVENGCSLRRPDLLLDLGYQVIIVEIDETQHKSYEEICNHWPCNNVL
jgi:hypothetical protein